MTKKSRKKPVAPTLAGGAPPPLDRTDFRNVVIVALVAAAVRIVFYFLHRHNNPLFDNPIMDALYHHEWAQRIAGGDVLGDGVFFRAPLYPYFLALLYKMSGSSIALAIAVQQLLGVVSAVLVYLLSREYFGRASSLLAGVAAALYWPFLYFEGDLLIVTLVITLDLAALLLTARALRRDRLGLYVAAGLLFGLSAVARPSVLIVLPFLPFVFRVRHRSMGPLAARTLLLYAGALLAIAPVLVRNYVVGHDVVPIASQGGVNFYIGNNPESDGRTAIVPGTRWDWWGGYEDAIRLAETEKGHALKPSEVSNYYFAKGLRFVFTSPDQSLPLLARKLWLFWAGGERSNNKYIYFFWHQSGMGRVPLPGFWLVAPFGLAGVILLWRRRREFALLYVFLLTYMAGVVAFFVNARFRLPVVPILIIFGAYAAWHMVTLVRRRRPGLFKTSLLVVACVVVVDADFLRFQENKIQKDSLSHYTLGNAYLKQKKTALAIREYETAFDVYRRYPTPGFRLVERSVRFNLGSLYASNRECAKAIPLLERVAGNDDFTLRAMTIVAGCYVEQNRYIEAIRTCEQILRAAPGHPDASATLVNAAVMQARQYAGSGDHARAAAVLQRALAIVPGDPALTRELNAIGGSP